VRAKWPQHWITTAEEILKEQWTKYYKVSEPSALTDSQSSSSNNYFAELDNFSSDPTTDPLDEWLASPPLPTVADPIAW
jgi:hypothetical protein